MATSQRQPLLIPPEVYDAMISHCIKGSDLACCGILAGAPPLASAIYPLRNTAKSAVRYDADHQDLLSATMDYRARGLTLVAIYKFHPNFAAIPSLTDVRENNYGDLPRVIISLGKVTTVRVWSLTAPNCEELEWCLLPREERCAFEDAKGYLVRLEVERSRWRPGVALFVSDRSSPRVFWWQRRSAKIAVDRPRDLPPMEHEPMWDPLLDSPP